MNSVRGMTDLLRWPRYWALLLSVTASLAPAQQSTHVASSGNTVVGLSADGSNVRVTISTHEVKNGTPSKPVIPKHSACTMSRMPCSVVDAVAVSVNGEALFIPRSVFCDLADVGAASLQTTRKGWVLTLTGGDASESYSVTIEFDATSVHRRTLTAAEAGQKLQETNYYRVVLGD
jgi:hypothetical protein